MAAALSKYFRENGLVPTNRHAIYCFRHSFADRMQAAGLEMGLRMALMGHSSDDRPEHRDPGALAWKRDGLAKMVLPFDPAIV